MPKVISLDDALENFKTDKEVKRMAKEYGKSIEDTIEILWSEGQLKGHGKQSFKEGKRGEGLERYWAHYRELKAEHPNKTAKQLKAMIPKSGKTIAKKKKTSKKKETKSPARKRDDLWKKELSEEYVPEKRAGVSAYWERYRKLKAKHPDKTAVQLRALAKKK